MDLIAALALVMVLEGLALAILAKSIPEMLAEMEHLGGARLRIAGIVIALIGIVVYLAVRGSGDP